MGSLCSSVILSFCPWRDHFLYLKDIISKNVPILIGEDKISKISLRRYCLLKSNVFFLCYVYGWSSYSRRQATKRKHAEQLKFHPTKHPTDRKCERTPGLALMTSGHCWCTPAGQTDMAEGWHTWGLQDLCAFGCLQRRLRKSFLAFVAASGEQGWGQLLVRFHRGDPKPAQWVGP